MYFPLYWAKGSYTGKTQGGKEMTIAVYGWSSESLEDAKHHAQERARRVIEKGIGSDRSREYEYGNAPFREEIVDTLSVEGQKIALISRNRYGSLVLNSANVMFVDIDFPEIVSTGFRDSVQLFFSAKKRKEREEIIRKITLDKVDDWSRRNPSKSFRLYQTHSGLRLLMTDSVYEPQGDESKDLLRELMADRLYCSLTERQECYRARLTPKPWRCGASRPPSTFPWETEEEEKHFRTWKTEYEKLSEGFSTCVLHSVYGDPAEDPFIQEVIACHDSFTVRDSRPLA